MPFVHTSVMPGEVLRYWVNRPDGLYVDGTVGGGGHCRRLLETYPQVHVIAVDQDPQALAAAEQELSAYSGRITFLRGNFRELASLVGALGIETVDGVLLDLGVSSPQLDVSERGFTYQKDAPLDMRMDPDNPITAFRLINTRPADEIGRMIRDYGEERWAGRIAQFIEKARLKEPIRTTGQLVELIKAAIPASARRTGGHPARRTFQALRIWVNDELASLEQGLPQALEIMAPSARLVVIAFHSLEDRIVKTMFRQWQQDDKGKVLTRRPLTPGPEETEANPRARSAKLRVFEKS